MPTNPQIENSSATSQLLRILEENLSGRAVGIYSICSANRYVLEAGMLQAARDHQLLLIESTSNQVNQFGGYTGQTPADFASFVRDVARRMNFPVDRIVLGGDHLGPHVWRKESPDQAMAKARHLVCHCVRAGYTKIHLDASMPLRGDPIASHAALADEIVSLRTAELCQSAEEAYQALPAGSPAPLYVIGTEVPIPGGEQSETQAPEVTSVKDLEHTLRLAREAFVARHLEGAWRRVVAVVVQGGAEFGDDTIFPYDHNRTKHLADFAGRGWHGVYEAHSTDYQSPAALQRMVQDHFAILKTGPSLTFAFREAVFALAAIEEEWLSTRRGMALSSVREALEHAMLANPVHWKGYYRGDEEALRFARKYSYSDRVRYYWPQPEVNEALERLIANLVACPAPLSLLSQYLPNQYEQVRAGQIPDHPADLIRSKILEVLDGYACACGMKAL